MSTNLGELLLAGAIALLTSCPIAWSAAAVQRKPTGSLEQLADSHFSNLSECERNLLRNAPLGEIAFCGPTHSSADQAPDQGAARRQKYDVRAKLMRWLCVDPAAANLVDPRGTRVRAARVVGQLDLSFATVPFPLLFENSRFTEDIILTGSQLVALSLAGSHTRGIKANGVTVRHGLFLNIGFSADSEVRLQWANIKGTFVADGGHFKDPSKVALRADWLKASVVSLLDGFSAEGEVSLAEANLDGDLESDGQFKNPGEVALAANGLKATNVYFRNGFSAEGEVSLIGANLSGRLESGGHFKNPGKFALSADGLKAAGVLLRNGFSAEGEVSLPRANLSADLESDGQFKNPGEVALSADGLKAAAVLLRNGFSVEGRVVFSGSNIKGPLDLRPKGADELVLDLDDATVGSLSDEEKSWPKQGNVNLDGFVYTRIVGGPKDAQSRLRWLDLQRPFSAQPYEQLAKVLREEGDEAGAKSVLIAMGNARWRFGTLGFWDRCGSWILWLTIANGYNTWQALWFIAFFVILGTLLFQVGYKSEAIQQTDKDNPRHCRPFNAFVYSLETFLPLVDLGQAKHWAPDAEKSISGKRLRWYLWFHILLGWFFTLVFAAGVAGLVQKG